MALLPLLKPTAVKLPDPSVVIFPESLFTPFVFKLFKLDMTSGAFIVVPLVRVTIVAPA